LPVIFVFGATGLIVHSQLRPQILWRQRERTFRLRAVNVNSIGDAGRNTSFIRVLGVDPAAAGPTGYGVVESDGRNSRIVHYGALTISAKRRKECHGAALQDVYALLSRLIEEFEPQVMAVEGVFAALNVRTALRLAEVRGVVLLAAAQHNITVHSYSPREVKCSVAGYGHADKRQVQEMVRAILTMDRIPEPSDAADALAVALCHLQAERTRRTFALPEVPKTPRRSTAAATLRAIDVAPGALKPYATRASLSRIVPTR
jgi:crossover junction endodeoxyribonuclease RuvC